MIGLKNIIKRKTTIIDNTPLILKTMTAEDIIKRLHDKNISWAEIGYQEVDWNESDFGKVNVVASYGGEGQGDIYYVVYHFVDHDKYIKIDGFFSYNNGVEFNNAPYEVTPQQKIITVYN